MAQEAERRTGDGREDYSGRSFALVLRRHGQQAHGRDEAHASGQAVHPVDEVHGVGDGHDPDDREEHRERTCQVAAEHHVDTDAHTHQQERRHQLHHQPEHGGQAELVVDEAGHDHERAAQEDGKHVDLHVFDGDGPQQGAHDEGDGHGGEDGEATGVGEGLLVQAPAVGLVGPTHLEGEHPQPGHEPPHRQPGDDERHDDNDPPRAAWISDTQGVEEVDYVMHQVAAPPGGFSSVNTNRTIGSERASPRGRAGSCEHGVHAPPGTVR